MRYGGEGYIDLKGTAHAAICEIEKNGNYIEAQRYTVDMYKKAAGITGNGTVEKNPDYTIYDNKNAATGAEVKQVTLNDGTHGWAGSSDHTGDMKIIGIPNEKFSASDAIGQFL